MQRDMWKPSVRQARQREIYFQAKRILKEDKWEHQLPGLKEEFKRIVREYEINEMIMRVNTDDD
jgi:hypothetical protein